jgi:hypothetical protein
MDLHEFIQLGALARAHDFTVSFFKLLTDGSREETFIVLRAIYECYVVMVCLEWDLSAADALIARYFIGNGTYEYKSSKSGRLDRRTVVNVNTGIEYRVRSLRSMAEQSPLEIDREFHEAVYEDMSQHAHFDLASLSRYFSQDRGFSRPLEPDFNAAFLYGFCIIKMICDAVASIGTSTNDVRRDARYLAKKIKRALLAFLKALEADGGHPGDDLKVALRRLDTELPKSLRNAANT